MNGKLFAELCDELISEVIPVIKSGNDNIYYTRNGKDMIFCIDKRMKELERQIPRDEQKLQKQTEAIEKLDAEIEQLKQEIEQAGSEAI